MMKLSAKAKSQTGSMNFLAMFAIALVVVLTAGWAIANRGSNTSTSASIEQTKMNASMLLKQASDFKDGFARAQSDGYYPGNITFDAALPAGSGAGLFSAGKGYATMQTPPIKAGNSGVTAATFIWSYDKLALITGIGTNAADYIISISDLNIDVCKRINNMLYNTAMTDEAIPSATDSLMSSFSAGTAVTLDSSSVLNGMPTVAGKTDLCVKTTDGTPKYVYYKVLIEN